MGPSLWLLHPSSAMCFFTPSKEISKDQTLSSFSHQPQTTANNGQPAEAPAPAPAQAQHQHVNPAITGQANTTRHSPFPSLHYCQFPNFNCHTARPAWPTFLVALPDCPAPSNTPVHFGASGVLGNCLAQLLSTGWRVAQGSTRQVGRQDSCGVTQVFYLFSPGPSSPCPLLGILWPNPHMGFLHNPIPTDMAIS